MFRLIKFFKENKLAPGCRIAIVADNSVEWWAMYMATLMFGGIAVPLRTSLSPQMLFCALENSGASLILLQHSRHLEMISEAYLPDLSCIVTVGLKGDPESDDKRVVPMTYVKKHISQTTLAEQTEIQEKAAAIPANNWAMICYRVNSPHELYGATFSHHQLVTMIAQISAWFTLEADDLAFTLTPWSEQFSLATSLHYFLAGVNNVIITDYDDVIATMRHTSPTVMIANPLAYEKLHEAYLAWVRDSPESTQDVFRWALAKGKEYQAAGESRSLELHREYSRADATFFSQLRGQIGGRIRCFYSTGALLSHEIAEFFSAIGMPIINVYSVVEAGGFPAVGGSSQLAASSGKIAAGFEIKLGSHHEILVRGDTAARHYWQNPIETKKISDHDYWLHTGDVGHLDAEGNLFVSGYEPHLFVLSNGRRVLPSLIEKLLNQSPFINQAALIGDGKAYLSAMIAVDLAALQAHFHPTDGRIISASHPQVKTLFDTIISEINEQLDSWEQIREYSLLDQLFKKETGELTPSLRISRHVVEARYADKIQAMYPTSFRIEAKEVSQVEIEPERLRDLLEKETLLDAWMADAGIEFLFELAREKQIEPASMVNICDIAATIAQIESEEKPLSTAIIVGNPTSIARVLPVSQIQLHQHDHIRRMRKVLITLTKIVDGLVLGYVVDRYGYVRGIHRLEVKLPTIEDSIMGPQFRHHAAISKQCDALVFFVPYGGRQVRVFANGELVGRYTNGDWFPERISQASDIMHKLAAETAYDLNLLNRILRCAFQMSEKNLGAVFLIGQADVILQNSDASEISSFALIIKANLQSLSDDELINFAKQDGATVIDASGEFRGCMVLLRPGANTQADIGPGKGARHSSAAKMSVEANCVAITVSQDGPITVYNNGRIVLAL